MTSEIATEEKIMIQAFTDIFPSFFGTLNRGPLTLAIFLHGLIVLPMFFIYFSEKKKIERGEPDD